MVQLNYLFFKKTHCDGCGVTILKSSINKSTYCIRTKKVSMLENQLKKNYYPLYAYLD